ncbi:hypothetical protein AB0F17_61850 [Nonomuraea sp. NPDC026600]|uniref:hypothetical protein n=1 Tax=Nonomuraea sp. NPDC026600 TaxID=3155363 RepID=UPI0033D1AFA9
MPNLGLLPRLMDRATCTITPGPTEKESTTMSNQDSQPISISCGDRGATVERDVLVSDDTNETGDSCPRHTSVKELIAAADLPNGALLKECLPELARYVLPPLAQARPPIITVEDLAGRTDAELAVPGFGAGRLAKLKDALAQRIGRSEPPA